MDTIAELIDAARARTGANYTEIAERLERSKQLVTNWRKGDKVPGDGDVMALARMAGEDADRWLAIAQAARVDGEARVRWQAIARRLAATAALLAVGFLGAAPAPSQAAHGHEDAGGTRHYAKWPMWVRLLWLWLGTRFARPTGSSIEARTV